MSYLKIYRTYPQKMDGKDPVIFEIKTLLQDEGLIKKLEIVHQLSGVSTSTLDNWFNGETKCPQNRTICAVTSALGYGRKWEKVKDIEIDKELKIAMAWNKRQEKIRQDAERKIAPPRKPNGNHKERRASLS